MMNKLLALPESRKRQADEELTPSGAPSLKRAHIDSGKSGEDTDSEVRLNCYDPTYDVIFKLLFHQHKEFLISFINSAIGLDGNRAITEISFLETEAIPATPEEKGIRFDIRAVSSNGDRYIVEMQRKREPDYEKRTVYYASKSIVSQLDEAEKEGKATDKRHKTYQDIDPVIVISILDHTLFRHNEGQYIKYFKTVDVNKMDRQLLGSPSYIYIELETFLKYNRHYLDGDIEHMDAMERWAYILKEAPKMQSIPQNFKGTVYGDALKALNRNQLTPTDRNQLDKFIRDQEAQERKEREMQAALLSERQRADAEKQRADAEKQRADEAHHQLIQTINNLSSRGFSSSAISSVTGISEDEVSSVLQNR